MVLEDRQIDQWNKESTNSLLYIYIKLIFNKDVS